MFIKWEQNSVTVLEPSKSSKNRCHIVQVSQLKTENQRQFCRSPAEEVWERAHEDAVLLRAVVNEPKVRKVPNRFIQSSCVWQLCVHEKKSES